MAAGASFGGDFTFVKSLGRGAFGDVTLVRCSKSGGYFAAKKVYRKQPSSRERTYDIEKEKEALQALSGHPNVLPLHLTLPHHSGHTFITEFFPLDLSKLQSCCGPQLSEQAVQAVALQLFEGLAFVHGRGYLHRDIKPSNIFLAEDGRLVLGDFGLVTRTRRGEGSNVDDGREASDKDGCVKDGEGAAAGAHHSSGALSSHVGSRWYRAPELLFGSTSYSATVDTWAAACLLAELLAGCPLLPGRTDIEQMTLAVQLLGSPCRERWEEYESMPDAGKLRFKECAHRDLSDCLPGTVSLACLDFLGKLLCYSGTSRMTAVGALQHPWLAAVGTAAAVGAASASSAGGARDESACSAAGDLSMIAIAALSLCGGGSAASNAAAGTVATEASHAAAGSLSAASAGAAAAGAPSVTQASSSYGTSQAATQWSRAVVASLVAESKIFLRQARVQRRSLLHFMRRALLDEGEALLKLHDDSRGRGAAGLAAGGGAGHSPSSSGSSLTEGLE